MSTTFSTTTKTRGTSSTKSRGTSTTTTRPARKQGTSSPSRGKGSYTAARRAARKAAQDRSVRRQLVRGRSLLTLSVLRRDRTTRWPFAIVFGAIAAITVVALLMLNTATAQSSFTERALNDKLSELTLKEQAIKSEVAQANSPQAIAEAAGELGMVPGANPGYLVIHPDGSVEWVEPTDPPPSAAEQAAAQAAAQQAAAEQAAAEQAAAQAAAEQAAAAQAAADQAAAEQAAADQNSGQPAPGA